MSYNLKVNIANKNNYGDKRSLSDIKYIVIHYTANDGDTDENNGKFFKNNVVESSAHYFVDSDSVTQSVADDYVAWSVGGNKYNNNGGTLYKKCTNANSISIELCDDVKNGIVKPNQKTINNAIELTRNLMNKYNIPLSNVIRHYDVTGKPCPLYWCGDAYKDGLWVTEFKNKLLITTTTTSSTDVIKLYRVQCGAFSSEQNAKQLKNKLESHGFTTVIKHINGLYKVQVGAYSDKKNAEIIMSKVKSKGYDSIISYY